MNTKLLSLFCVFLSASCFAVEPWNSPRTADEFDAVSDRQYNNLSEWLSYDPRWPAWRRQAQEEVRAVWEQCKNPPLNLPKPSGCKSRLRVAVDYNGFLVTVIQEYESPLAQCMTENIKATRFPPPLVSPWLMTFGNQIAKCTE